MHAQQMRKHLTTSAVASTLAVYASAVSANQPAMLALVKTLFICSGVPPEHSDQVKTATPVKRMLEYTGSGKAY